MTTITLDAGGWQDFRDIYAAMLPALGAPDWHGPSPDAVYDALVAGHYRAVSAPVRGSGRAAPHPRALGDRRDDGDAPGRAEPLIVTVTNVASANAAVQAYLARLATVFDDARTQYGAQATLRLA